jgi:hypothetical protein
LIGENKDAWKLPYALSSQLSTLNSRPVLIPKAALYRPMADNNPSPISLSVRHHTYGWRFDCFGTGDAFEKGIWMMGAMQDLRTDIFCWIAHVGGVCGFGNSYVRLLTYGLYSVVFHGIATRFLRMGFLEEIDSNDRSNRAYFSRW